MAAAWSQDDEKDPIDVEEEGVISQEDCWSVIQSYFDENVCISILCTSR